MPVCYRGRPKVPIRSGCESTYRSGCAVAGAHARKAGARSGTGSEALPKSHGPWRSKRMCLSVGVCLPLACW